MASKSTDHQAVTDAKNALDKAQADDDAAHQNVTDKQNAKNAADQHVTDTQSALDQAQNNVDTANADVTAKQNAKSAADQNVTDTQNALDQAQHEADTANADVTAKQNAKNAADQAVNDAKTALDNAKNGSHEQTSDNTSIKLPAGYDPQKAFASREYVSQLQSLNKFTDNAADKQIKVTVGPNNTLSADLIKQLSIYAAQLLNSAHEQLGYPKYQVNAGTVAMAQWESENITNPNLEDLEKSTWDETSIGGPYTWDSSFAGDTDMTHRNITTSTNLNDLKKLVYNSIVNLLGSSDVNKIMPIGDDDTDIKTEPYAVSVYVTGNGEVHYILASVKSSIPFYFQGMNLGDSEQWNPSGRYAQLAKTTYAVPEPGSGTTTPSTDLTELTTAYNNAVAKATEAATALDIAQASAKTANDNLNQARTAHDNAVATASQADTDLATAQNNAH